MAIRYTTESYAKRVVDETNGEYAVFGDYRGVHNYMSYYHTVCGQVTKIRPVEFFNAKHSTRCTFCMNKNRSKNTEWFRDEMNKLVGDEYSLNSAYTKAKEKVLIKHELCGYSWKVTPDNFLRRNSRCPKCSGNARMDTEIFKEYMNSILGDDYAVMSDYSNMHTKVTIKHYVCDMNWDVEPSSLVQGTRCPFCSSSRGEQLIQDILKRNEVSFVQQKRFEDCVYKGKLPFDFYIESSNLLIEYDGIQHYQPVDFAGRGTDFAEELFVSGKIRDGIKTKWAKDNNIKLLRVPYTLSEEEVSDLVVANL